MRLPSRHGYVRPFIHPTHARQPTRHDGTYARRMWQELFGAPATLCRDPIAFPTLLGSAWDRWRWTFSSGRLPRWPEPISPSGSVRRTAFRKAKTTHSTWDCPYASLRRWTNTTPSTGRSTLPRARGPCPLWTQRTASSPTRIATGGSPRWPHGSARNSVDFCLGAHPG